MAYAQRWGSPKRACRVLGVRSGAQDAAGRSPAGAKCRSDSEACATAAPPLDDEHGAGHAPNYTKFLIFSAKAAIAVGNWKKSQFCKPEAPSEGGAVSRAINWGHKCRAVQGHTATPALVLRVALVNPESVQTLI